MLRIVNALSTLVRRAPWVAIAVVVLITIGLGYFVPQAEEANDQEGFAPDAPELSASGRIPDLFGDESSGSVMQVIVSSDEGDVITPEGLQTVELVTETLQSSAIANRLQEQPGQGSVVSFFAPLDGAAQGGPTVQIVVSSDSGDVFTAEAFGLTQAVTGAVFQSPIAAKLSVADPQAPPIISYLAPLGGPPSEGPPTAMIVVSSADGDVISEGGLQASMGASGAVLASPVAQFLNVSDPQTPPVLSFLMPVESGIAQGSVAADIDTSGIKIAYGLGLEQLPEELGPVLGQLLSSDAEPDIPKASSGIIVLNLSEPLTPEIESALEGALHAVELQDGFSLTLIPSQFTTTSQVKASYLANSAFLPAEFSGFLPFLSSSDSDLTIPRASRGMVVVNLTEELTASELGELSEIVGSIPTPGGYSLSIPSASEGTAELKQSYLSALSFVPADQAGLVQQLLSTDSDLAAATASHGLMIVFLQFPEEGDIEQYSDDLLSAVDEIAALQLSEGYAAEAFTFDLLLADDGSFNDEIARIFRLAGLIIVGILILVYWLKPKGDLNAVRSARRTLADTAVTIVTILFAITWMQGIGVLLSPTYLDVIGHSSSMAQILPILLIGLGVDYGIHLTSRYREEVGELGVKPAISASIKTVGVALVLATLTTMVGFLTNLVSPVPALVDFGVLAAVGILSSFILMLTFVPAVRQLLDGFGERRGTLPAVDLATSEDRLLNRIIGKTSVIAEKFAWGAVIAAVILAGAGELGRQQLETKFSFTDFIPVDNPILGTIETLTEEFGGGFGEVTAVLIEGDVATVAVHNAGIDALEALADTDDVLLFAGQVASSPLTLIESMTDGSSPQFKPAVAAAAAAAGVGDDLRVVDGTDLSALYAAVKQADPEAYSAVIHETSGAQDAALWNINTQAGDERVAELRVGLLDAFSPVSATGVGVVATSQNIIGNVVVTSLQESQVQSLGITLLAATLILVLNFWFDSKRPLLGVITMAPVGLVVLLTFGMMALTGIPFGPVTATISALAIGIGVPYTIHITHRFQEDRERFATTEEAIRSTMLHTGSALAGSALTTMAGFGVLVTSTLPPFQQFGAVTAYAIGFALLVSILILPSMLAIWDRWHKGRGDLAPEPKSHETAMEATPHAAATAKPATPDSDPWA